MTLMDQLVDLWERCHFPNEGGLKLLSLRGTFVENKTIRLRTERVDFFDDTLFLFDPSKNKIDHVPCTAGQPGWYWINRYEEGEGAPFTRFGAYAYVRGMHRGIYEALRQEQTELGRLAVIRDVNHNGEPEFATASVDTFEYPLSTGINIHACEGVPARVGIWSSGCHVVQGDWDGYRWETVYTFTYQVYRNQKRFWYGVCDGTWVTDHTQRLLMGSVGPAVVELHKFLKSKGVANLDNKRFLKPTDEAYRKWQRMNKQPQTGICANPPWLQR